MAHYLDFEHRTDTRRPQLAKATTSSTAANELLHNIESYETFLQPTFSKSARERKGELDEKIGSECNYSQEEIFEYVLASAKDRFIYGTFDYLDPESNSIVNEIYGEYLQVIEWFMKLEKHFGRIVPRKKEDTGFFYEDEGGSNNINTGVRIENVVELIYKQQQKRIIN